MIIIIKANLNKNISFIMMFQCKLLHLDQFKKVEDNKMLQIYSKEKQISKLLYNMVSHPRNQL
jgi:hypothetical protein